MKMRLECKVEYEPTDRPLATAHADGTASIHQGDHCMTLHPCDAHIQALGDAIVLLTSAQIKAEEQKP